MTASPRTILALALIAFLPLACQTESPDEAGSATEPAADEATLEAAAVEALNGLSDRYESTYNERDAAGIAAMYVEDAMWLPPDGPRVEGRAAIQQAMEGTYASMPELSWSLESDAYRTSSAGDAAVGHGTFHTAGTDSTGQAVDATYQWMATYRNVDGSWKITRVMWNQGGPAMAAGSGEPAK